MIGATLPVPLPDAPARLARLSREAHKQASISDYPTPPWNTNHQAGTSVLIVGGGQAGLVTAYGLRRKGIAGVLVVDAAPEGSAGPWDTYARMHTLRTPKDIKWPTWGVPAASPRAWFDARYGEDAWERIDQFPTADWHAFLEWYRISMGITVRFDTTVTEISGGSGNSPFRVGVRHHDGSRHTVTAQRVVLATGLEGAGGRNIPRELFAGIPTDRYAHTHDRIDFAALAGQRIGVLGGGTGAFDNAATALEAGAASAVVHLRRPAMPTVSPYRWMEFPGIIEHYASFTDEQKWAFNVHLSRVDQPATQNAIWRAFAFETFAFRCASPWNSATWTGEEIVVRTPQGEERYDFVIAATGISVDVSQRPELSDLAEHIMLWRDRLAPELIELMPHLGAYPYLDEHFGLRSADAGHEQRLRRIHLFNHGARLSTGVLSHQISGLYGGVRRLVDGIADGFFRDASSALLEQFLGFDTPAGVVIGPRDDAQLFPSARRHERA
ncbi:FAD-dependent oxidoreductase [Herbiconiux ginsengi]|uniref:FAD/NAD(P)-binding domain-containing protein n=1 Tax=Herbiconiux ginsengi TaxID=381665 RepID=A0A1H3S2F6_9MICO|nr:NAD(P)/FAD-dependent oxidoreductase [Herbiconiux ginsengi]SDZ31349.1 hypothetical protein SAMN05216554_3210 [Herbiconiux ginsengi]